MKIRHSKLREYKSIEDEFFEIDEAKGEATIRLHFETPGVILNENCLTKTPMFVEEFKEWLGNAFEIIPERYRIAFDISFDDPQGYTSEELREIFSKNMALSAGAYVQSVRSRNRIGYGLIAAGLVSFLLMVLAGHAWEAENLWHEIFFYFLDIVTTVLLWETAGILLVETRENRSRVRGFRERYASVTFHGCAEEDSGEN